MLGTTLDADQYLLRLQRELSNINLADVRRWADLVYHAWEQGRCIYVCGNGGSGTTATHFSQDLVKSTLPPDRFGDETAKRLKILSLTDNTGWMLAVGNDIGFADIFVQQLMTFGQAGDLVLAISGSGNSENVLRAVAWANRHGLTTFGLTGYDGGRLKALQQHGIHINLQDMGMVESIHLALFHWVLNDVYARINNEGRYAIED